MRKITFIHSIKQIKLLLIKYTDILLIVSFGIQISYITKKQKQFISDAK
jgi:hypothetical protein